MGGRTELVKGDLFDGPSDLVVIPCSTHATITWFVAQRLRNFAIPEPERSMRLGEVVIHPLPQAESVASAAAYAASVLAGRGSDQSAIRQIGEVLGRHADSDSSVRSIACPLLGTGAGGLVPIESARALAEGFLATAPDHAVLRIFVLKEHTFDVLRTELTDGKKGHERLFTLAERPIRVFISYTRSSDQHAEFVEALASHLRMNGLDARLDAWHLRAGMDMAQWMCNELDLADRVVLICDELYAQKADHRHGGVGWEIRLVQGDLLRAQPINLDKYLPVVVTDDLDDGLPAFLRSVFSIHWPARLRDNDGKVEELLRALYRVQAEAPPLGHPPSFVIRRG